MPYFVHPKDHDPLPDEIGDFREEYCSAETRESAFTLLKDTYTVQSHMITFRATYHERQEWRRRERERFRTGKYVVTPWNEDGNDYMPEHYAHISLESPGMIAYTPDVEKGVMDRTTRTRPGRYLEQFYGDRFSKSTIDKYVDRCAAMANGDTLQIARTEDEVVAVYTDGPSSCMDGHHFDEMHIDRHPAAVYSAPSDLAVAYVGDINSASQRCVIWPDKQIYSRIYGTGPLAYILQKAGYSPGDLDGAKIRLIRTERGRILMPYVDNCDGAEIVSQSFMRLGSGPISCSETCGYVYGEEHRSCDHCGNSYDSDNEGDSEYCQNCCDNLWTCDKCDGAFFTDMSRYGRTVGDQTWCRDCYDAALETCQDENCSRQWLEINEFTPEETTERKRRDTIDLCRECASRYVWCETCEKTFDGQTCDTCDRSPRCEHTADLLTSHVNDYKLELYRNDGGWQPCYFDVAARPAIGDFERLISYRQDLQAKHPDTLYRIVPLVPLPAMIVTSRRSDDSPF